MITCCIQYTLDPHKLEAFEKYAARWPSIIEHLGGNLVDDLHRVLSPSSTTLRTITTASRREPSFSEPAQRTSAPL